MPNIWFKCFQMELNVTFQESVLTSPRDTRHISLYAFCFRCVFVFGQQAVRCLHKIHAHKTPNKRKHKKFNQFLHHDTNSQVYLPFFHSVLVFLTRQFLKKR